MLGAYAMMEDVRAGRLQASRIVNPDLKRFVTLAMPKKGPLTLVCKVIAQLIQQTARELESPSHWAATATRARRPSRAR